MSILIGATEFQGPFYEFDLLRNDPGVYVVLWHRPGEYELLELGDAERLRDHLKAHPDRQMWQQSGPALCVAVHYVKSLTDKERFEIKAALEDEFDCELAA